MPSAEIFRIIDVLASSGGPASTPEGGGARDDDAAASRLPGRQLTLRAGTAVEVPAPPAPAPRAIELQHVGFSRMDERLVTLSGPDSPQARSFRLLRHRVLAAGDPRVIAVTSAVPADGKTTCAANLALVLAEEATARVLLLEANLRRPALARLFGFDPLGSLVDGILRFTKAEPPFPVAALEFSRLHVAALPPTSPLEGRLDRALFASALHHLRGAYDYVVIDAAAVLESGDADVVGECASATILVARRGSSNKSEVRSAVAHLAPARVLGTVLLEA